MELPKPPQKNFWLIVLVILLVALAFRLSLARFLPNDDPDDGRIYAQIAVDLLDHTTFSQEDVAPFTPTLIRVPGYPIYLAIVYSIGGHGENGAVRYAQALMDTITCALVGLLAWLWMPDKRLRWRAALVATAVAAVCPFTAIYVATILTETLTTFLMVALALTATLALQRTVTRRAILWWVASGSIAGTGVMVRPDAGLFAAAAGFALVLIGLFSHAGGATSFSARFVRVVTLGAVYSAAFVLILVPWTIRNKAVFGVFQPLAPAHAEMPGEFVSYGYFRWLRTWVDGEKYIEPVIWSLDDKPIMVDQLPAKAFDSPEEKARVAALLDRYNHPVPGATNEAPPVPKSGPTQTLPMPGTGPAAPPKPNTGNANSGAGQANDDADSDQDDGGDGGDADDSADTGDDGDVVATVEMTPEIDAGFAQLAQERINRSPIRYYVWMPVKRLFALWFGTHSQYYPFAGELFPWSELDRQAHQQIWLPLFALIVTLYTIIAKLGGFVLLFWKREGRKWALLLMLMVLPRFIFFSTIENPEPRYVVEVFALCSVLAGIAGAYLWRAKEPIAVEPSNNSTS
ncbi:MAG: glycosyltransferase family 39 protein [Pyrinomonadaceae bacterium]